MSTPISTLIWDIQEEHLDEAEFLLETWTRAVDSARFTLASVRAGPEERLLARIDGLLVGGAVVIDDLLLPVLADADADDDEFRTAAAALTILEGAGAEACEVVLATATTAAREAESRARRGLLRALQLSRRAGLIPWLGRDLDQLRGPALADRLLALAGHRVNAGARVRGWLDDDALEVRRAAAALARHTGAAEVRRALVDSMTGGEDPALRRAARDSGLIRGLPEAWALVCAEAFDRDRPPDRSALTWVALLGDADLHQRLLAALADDPGPDRLWAVGLSGRVAAVDAAIDLLAHPTLARLAGEVVCAVAGLPRDDAHLWLDHGAPIGADPDEALPALADDDLEAELAPTGDEHLRLPDPEAVGSWWAQRRSGFDPALRHGGGRPLDIAQLARCLLALPTRRRHALALELAARSSGRAQLETRALTAVQHGQAQEIFGRLAFLDFQRGLPRASG